MAAAAFAAFAFSVCASPVLAQAPVAELPTYKIGDKWIRSDGTYELKRIDKDVYVFEAGKGNEIRLSKNLEMQTVMRDGRVEVDLEAGLRIRWPLEAGQIPPYLSLWRGTGLSVPEGNIGSDVRISARIEAAAPVTVPAGTFRAHRIIYTGAGGPQYAAVFSDFISLWYSPEARRFVKGQSSRITAMNFELTGLDGSAPPVVASAPVAPPTYKVGDKWIRSDGTYELKRIDKDGYIYEAGRGNEIHLSKNLELLNVLRDGRIEFGLDTGLPIAWPLVPAGARTTRADWRGPLPTGTSQGSVVVTWTVGAAEDVTVGAGAFKAYRLTYGFQGLGPLAAGGRSYGDAALWYAPALGRFVKGTSSVAVLNFELTGLDDRAPPVVAAAPAPAPPAAPPRPAPAQPAPTPPATVVPPTAPASPPVAAVPAPPPVVTLELQGPPGAQVRIGETTHALDAQGRFTLTLPPGQHHIDATKEGFVPAHQTVTLAPGQAKVTQRLAMAQIVPPTITVLDPKPGTPVRTPDVRLRVEVKSAYRVSALRVGKESDAAQQTFAPSAGVKAGESWMVEALVSLVEGDNRVRIEAVDEHGGKAEHRATIVRQSLVATPAPSLPAPVGPSAPPSPPLPAPASDNEAPKIALNYPPEGAKVDKEQIVVLGLVTDNVAVDKVLVSVNGRMVAMSGDAAVSARSHPVRTPVTLQPGDNVIEITAVDKAGNASQVVRMVTRSVPTVAATPPPPAPKNEQWAVVIGIGNYENVGIPRLKYTVSDADAVYQTLVGPAGFKKENVILLTDRSDRKPTLKNIKWALGTFLSRAAKKDDTVVIFFAGHGAPETDPRGLERDGLAKYLIPQDADPDDLYTTALPMDELQTIFARLESERVVAFLDACYSGAAGGRTFAAKKTRAGSVDDLFLERLTRSKGRAIVTASRPAEVSIELPELGHGIFTYYLVEGLKGAADLNRDGIVMLQELYTYLEEQVTKKSRSVGGNQHPVMKGEMEGPLPLTKVKQK